MYAIFAAWQRRKIHTLWLLAGKAVKRAAKKVGRPDGKEYRLKRGARSSVEPLLPGGAGEGADLTRTHFNTMDLRDLIDMLAAWHHGTLQMPRGTRLARISRQSSRGPREDDLERTIGCVLKGSGSESARHSGRCWQRADRRHDKQ